MTNETERIKLAEAMGWGRVPLKVFSGENSRVWESPEGVQAADSLPDPFTDANDDYAVLEWAIKNLDPDAYFAALTKVVGSYAYLTEYRIGYWATAALRVLEQANEQ